MLSTFHWEFHCCKRMYFNYMVRYDNLITSRFMKACTLLNQEQWFINVWKCQTKSLAIYQMPYNIKYNVFETKTVGSVVFRHLCILSWMYWPLEEPKPLIIRWINDTAIVGVILWDGKFQTYEWYIKGLVPHETHPKLILTTNLLNILIVFYVPTVIKRHV